MNDKIYTKRRVLQPNDQADPPRADDASPQPTRNRAVGSSALLDLPHPIYHLRKGYKLMLLESCESEAKAQYNSMSPAFRERFLVGWGQASPRRVDGIYPDDKDWQQKIPHCVQEGEENGSPVYRQL